MENSAAPRRPLKTRQRAWAQALARGLTRAGVAPNTISILSIFCAGLAAFALVRSAGSSNSMRPWFFVLAAAGIQLRLLCNMLDGLMAVEGGRRTVYGEIYNDAPDRLADVLILVAAGYATAGLSYGRELGWVAAILAVITAYVRLLGGSMGVAQYFIGPMAKQHRMFVMTLACLVSIVEGFWGWRGETMRIALMAIVLGAVVTAGRRLQRIATELKQR